MTNVKVYKMTKNAYRDYKYGVGGNLDLDIETARRKVSRNIMLAIPEKISKFITRYYYGSLHIYVNTSSDLIIKIKNGMTPHDLWEKHRKNHRKTSKLLNILMEVS